MTHTRWTALLILVASGAGCSDSPPEPVTSIAPSGEVTAPSEPTVAATDVQVAIKRWDEVQQWIAGQQGKIVVLDVWSNW